MAFCTDTDLLFWEPGVFADGAAVAQLLLAGLATSVSGTQVALSGVSLSATRVRPLDVIAFSGAGVTGAFPIMSIDSETQLTVSVLYDGLFVAGGAADDPARVGAAVANQAFAIRTFYPQRRVVTQMLLQAAGVDLSLEDAEGRVANPEALKRACVLGTLQMIYSALAASAAEPAKLQGRADLYERLYRRAMRGVRVEVETEQGTVVRELGVVELRRE